MRGAETGEHGDDSGNNNKNKQMKRRAIDTTVIVMREMTDRGGHREVETITKSDITTQKQT